MEGWVLGCGIWEREENKNYFIFDSLGHLGLIGGGDESSDSK